MNKKLTTAILATTLLFTGLYASKAEEVKPVTLAIIDTALDTSLPQIKNNLVYEVCVLDWNSCPNGKSYMEGPGSAYLPLNILSKNGFDHGTQMTSAAIGTNPNVKVVFIRYVGATPTGDRQITNESSFIKALDWVIANKDKFNIKAVAMSQGHHNLANVIDYCPKTISTESRINSLTNAGVPVFLPAGNSRDLKRIDWPACIPASIAISASANGDGPALYTNYDPVLTDIFARGDMKLYLPGGTTTTSAGSSVSVQVAASSYLALVNKYPEYKSSDLINLLKTKTIPLVSRTIKNARVIDVSAVLNG